MSTFLRRWSSTLDYLNDTESALETNGGRPQTSLISKNLDEIVDLIRKPAFKLTDMVCRPQQVRGAFNAYLPFILAGRIRCCEEYERGGHRRQRTSGMDRFINSLQDNGSKLFI